MPMRGYFEFYIRHGKRSTFKWADRSIDTAEVSGIWAEVVEDAAGQPSELSEGRRGGTKVFKGSWNETFSNSQGSVRSKGTSNPRQWPFQRNRVALPLISGAGRNTRVLLRGTTASLKEGFQTIQATFMCGGDHLSTASTLILKDLSLTFSLFDCQCPATLVERKFVLNYRASLCREELHRSVRRSSISVISSDW